MAIPQPNTFSNKTYSDMWCRHAFVSVGYTSVNRGPGDQECHCLGKLCPALILTHVEGDEWFGICGADHHLNDC
jgi:hypothetical protein